MFPGGLGGLLVSTSSHPISWGDQAIDSSRPGLETPAAGVEIAGGDGGGLETSWTHLGRGTGFQYGVWLGSRGIVHPHLVEPSVRLRQTHQTNRSLFIIGSSPGLCVSVGGSCISTLHWLLLQGWGLQP
ncbi:hypothetical protein GQ53DRAFT_456923 [Thozetella sp. PMI_491]|nr:hypothetical protein GQ53DRAFT_456923 [Thozetella sp. PMI_491]